MRKLNILFILSVLFLFTACKKNKIPADVVLNPITQNVAGIQISWGESPDKNFQSYKLYKHSSSGIDEATGTLIHVSTSPTDKSFVDDSFDPTEKYFYRVYVQNKKGISGGSNIESIISESVTVVENGSFETGAPSPTGWTLIKNDVSEPLNEIEIDASKSSDGDQSLKFHHNSDPGCWEMWIQRNINLSDLSPGGTYQFSLDYLSNNPFPLSSGMGITLYNGNIDVQIPHLTVPGDGEWHQYNVEFTLPADIGSTDPLLRIHFCIEGITDWWIDDFKMVKV